MTTHSSQKSTRRRGLHLSRTKRKALRRRSQPALRYWTFLTRCFTSLRRRPAFRLIRAFKRLRTAFGALAMACWLPALAQAETFTVTTSSDTSAEEDGVLTLREAIILANENPGPDTIDFTDDLSGAVIKLTQGELAISEDLSIDASGLEEAPIIDADGKSRVLHFTTPEGDLSLTKLNLRNGKAPSNDDGGGILFASSGALTLTNSTLSGNSACSGGGIFTDSGAITLTNSTLSGNSAGYLCAGGGIYTDSGAVTLTNSTLSGNSSSGGYVSVGGGIRTGSGAVTLTNSTLSGNSSSGFLSFGGGIYTRSGAVTLTNSTLSGNSASGWYSSGWYVGGGDGGGISTRSGAVTLTNSTLSGNSASGDSSFGGGISPGSGAISLTNSIVAGNSSSGTAADISAPRDPANALEVSHSLIGDSSGARLDEAKVNLNNLIDIDPLLAPLADNGGPAQTMLPYPESPVINAGASTGHSTDQRSLAHLGAPDMGAVEFQGTSDLRHLLPLDHDGDDSSYQLEKAVGTDPFVADPSDPRLLQRPTFNAKGQAVLSFGISETALPGTRWVLERTTDLRTFEAIHRFDGTEHHAYEGRPVTITETETGVTIIDEAPPTGRVFYRLRISLDE